MKRKAAEEEFEGGEKRQRMWNHGVRWLRGELIGEGSFASVFLATPKEEKQTKGDQLSGILNLPPLMAVKSAEASGSEFIRHEAEVLLEIKGCPFVIERLGEELTTSSEDGDGMVVYNLLLEYASGGTLGDLIERSNGGHGLPESDVNKYTKSILEGIKHIHKCDYVHCDLKPDNILLVPTDPSSSTSTNDDSTSFVPKIADFGFAKRSKEDYGTWRGTRMYLSPEALEDNEQEQPSDIWSLGCIVLEMLTGKSLEDLEPGCDREDLHIMWMFDDHVCTPKIPADISAVARDFLRSCLAMRSSERLTAEQLLRHPFVAQPRRPSKEGRHTKVVTVPRIPPPPGFEIPAGL